MKKNLLLIPLALLLIVSLVACAAPAPEPTTPAPAPATTVTAPATTVTAPAPAPAEAEYKWRMGSPWMDKTRNNYLAVFGDLINVYSNGRIEVEFFPDGLLGPHDETFHAVQEGSVELGLFAPYVNIVPGGMLNWMPWTLGSYDEAAIAFDPDDGILFSVMTEAWKEVGLHMLWTTTLGAYGLGNNVRPIKHPEDLQNLKFRVSGSMGFVKALLNMGKGTGMTVETIPWAETYNALERGVVDGSWNLWGLLLETKFTEVTNYYTALDWSWDANSVVINKQVWDGLPPDLQDAIFRAGRVADNGVYEAMRRKDMGFKKRVADAGVEVYYPTPEEKAKFREKANMPAIWDELAKPWLEKHYPGQNMTQQILDELDRIRIDVEAAGG